MEQQVAHILQLLPSCELLAVGTKDQAIAATSRQLHNKSPAAGSNSDDEEAASLHITDL